MYSFSVSFHIYAIFFLGCITNYFFCYCFCHVYTILPFVLSDPVLNVPVPEPSPKNIPPRIDGYSNREFDESTAMHAILLRY